jgi:hypothetical protein
VSTWCIFPDSRRSSLDRLGRLFYSTVGSYFAGHYLHGQANPPLVAKDLATFHSFYDHYLKSQKPDTFRAISPHQLRQLAANLRNLVGKRRAWGEWRALAHDLVYETL